MGRYIVNLLVVIHLKNTHALAIWSLARYSKEFLRLNFFLVWNAKFQVDVLFLSWKSGRKEGKKRVRLRHTQAFETCRNESGKQQACAPRANAAEFCASLDNMRCRMPARRAAFQYAYAPGGPVVSAALASARAIPKTWRDRRHRPAGHCRMHSNGNNRGSLTQRSLLQTRNLSPRDPLSIYVFRTTCRFF